MTRGKSLFGCAVLALTASCGRSELDALSGLWDHGLDESQPEPGLGGRGGAAMGSQDWIEKGGAKRSVGAGGAGGATRGVGPANAAGTSANTAGTSSRTRRGNIAGADAGTAAGTAGRVRPGNSSAGGGGGASAASGGGGAGSGSGADAGEAGSTPVTFGCVDRTAVLAARGASEATDASGLGGNPRNADIPVSLDLASLPEPPAGQHLVLRRAPPIRSAPALGVAGAVTGLALVVDHRLQFGVNADPTLKGSAWTFTDVVGLAPSEDAVAVVIGGEDGFDVAWTVQDRNIRARRVVYARFATTGALADGPFVVAEADGLSCNLAKSRDTVALACAEPNESYDALRVVWLQLCRSGGACVRCTVAGGDVDLSQPAVAWDGSAFDIVYGSAGESAETLQLARVSPTGDLLLPPTILVEDELTLSAPAALWDGRQLAVAHGGYANLSLFDRNGARTQGPWNLLDPQQYSVPLVYAYRLALTPTGYAVFGAGWSQFDTSAESIYGSHLISLDRANPQQPKSMQVDPYAAGGSMAVVGGALVAIRHDTGLTIGRFQPSTLAPISEPEFLFSDPPRALSPIGVHCDSAACSVVANEDTPSFGSHTSRTGVWRVERASGKITPPAPEDTTPGVPFSPPAMRGGRSVAALENPESQGGTHIVSWNDAKKSSSDAWPVNPIDPIDLNYRAIDAFVEGQSTRVFFHQRVNDSVNMFHRLLTNGQLGEPTPSALGQVNQCGDAYVKLQGALGQSVVGTRWRPGVDADFTELFETPFQTRFTDWCCNASVIAMQGASYDAGREPWQTNVYSQDGKLVATRRGFHRQCVSAGTSLILWPDSERTFDAIRVYPDGTIQDVVLSMPTLPSPTNLATGTGPWALDAAEDTLAVAWTDRKDGTARLSLWRLP